MRIIGSTSVSTSRAQSINEMQSRESASRQSTRESMAHANKIIRISRLATMG